MIYKEFITKEEQENLISWAYDCKPNLNPNPGGPHRFFNQLENIQRNKKSAWDGYTNFDR